MDFRGMRIIENIHLTKTIEDWSGVRSPARARRRRAKHPQRIRIIQVPDEKIYIAKGQIICHPAIARELYRLAE